MDQGNAQVNPKKLFVGNLPYSTTEDQLKDVFSQYGELVSCTVITDRMTGRSKGIAFVEFATEEQAQAAVAGSEQLELDGRKVVVNVARPPRPREDRGFGGGFRGGRGGGGFRRSDRFDRGGR